MPANVEVRSSAEDYWLTIRMKASPSGKGKYQGRIPNESEFASAIVDITLTATAGRLYNIKGKISGDHDSPFDLEIQGGGTVTFLPTWFLAFSPPYWDESPEENAIDLTVTGCAFEEVLELTMRFRALSTNLDEVVSDLVKTYETNPTVNAVTFGFSEASIASVITSHFSAPTFDLDPGSKLSIGISVFNSLSAPPVAGFPKGTYAKIDIANKAILVGGIIRIDVAIRASGKQVATFFVLVEVKCRPALVVTVQKVLQLQVESAKLVDGFRSSVILDAAAVLTVFQSLNVFESELDAVVSSIVNQVGPYSALLSLYFESRPLPQYWNIIPNMDLTFVGFDYKSAVTYKVEVGYLFLVFSVRSLMRPLPCFCEEDESREISISLIPQPNDRADALMSTRQLSHVDRKLEAVGIGTVSFDEPEYISIGAAAFIAAFAFSQRAFREVARAFGEVADDKSISDGGNIYFSSRFWYRSTLNMADITVDGLLAVIDVDAEGEARATIRDNCGGKVASASVKLRIEVKDASVRWRFRGSRGWYSFILRMAAEASVEDILIDLDVAGSPPRPLDDVEEQLIGQTINRLARSYLKEVSSKLSFVVIVADEFSEKSWLQVSKLFFVEKQVAGAFLVLQGEGSLGEQEGPGFRGSARNSPSR